MSLVSCIIFLGYNYLYNTVKHGLACDLSDFVADKLIAQMICLNLYPSKMAGMYEYVKWELQQFEWKCI